MYTAWVSTWTSEMYRQVQRNGGFIYLVVEIGAEMPYLEEPFFATPESGLPDEPCSTLTVFSTLEGAEEYQDFCYEAREEKKHTLKVIKLHLSDLFKLIDEMEQFANHDHGALFKIYLVWSQSDDTVLAKDVLYMQGSVAN